MMRNMIEPSGSASIALLATAASSVKRADAACGRWRARRVRASCPVPIPAPPATSETKHFDLAKKRDPSK
jgi:hypothetical protein